MARTKKSTEPRYPMVLEQFGEPYLSGVGRNDVPSCLNGVIQVRRYRVTVELIDEPVDDIRARIVGLWRTCDNHHHWDSLRKAAAKVGLELSMNDFGKDRPREKKART